MSETENLRAKLSPEQVDAMIAAIEAGSNKYKTVMVVRVRLSFNKKRVLISTKNPVDYFKSVPVQPELLQILNGRPQCFIVLGIDLATGIAHPGMEIAGLEW